MEQDPKTSFSSGALGALRSNIYGFLLSLILTLGAFFLADRRLLSGASFELAIGALAIVQAIVQFVFFLKLGKRTDEWYIITIVFSILVLLIVVFGSVWIMNSLDRRVMP